MDWLSKLLFITASAIIFPLTGDMDLVVNNPAPEFSLSTDCSASTGIDKVICLANAFKEQLDAAQLQVVQRNYSTSEAKRWSNFPQAFLRNNGRVGLSFAAMTPKQLQYAKALVKEIAGKGENEGWDELEQIIHADDYLQVNGGGQMYGAANYYIAFLGTPATTGTFEIMYGGHHLAFANTYKDGKIASATPSFRGVEPFTTFTQDGKSNQPMLQEQAALSAMLNSLSPTELATAKLSNTYSDIIVGPQRDAAFPTAYSGFPCNKLNAAQKALVLAAIKTYVEDVAESAPFLKRYTDALDSTYIAYTGSTGLTSRNDYVRIDGPSLWIEYSCQGGIVLPGTHPHSVWRDKQEDYAGNK